MEQKTQYQPKVLVDDIKTLTREQWLRIRKCGIGGSDVAAILGISPYKTRKDLFWDKMNLQEENKLKEENETLLPKNWVTLEVGNALEPLVIRIFKERHPGWKVYLDRRMFYHPKYPWMIADCDAFCVDPRTGKTYPIEAKTTSDAGLAAWGEEFSNTVPPHYEAQVRHYMAVTGCDGAIVICLAGNHESGFRQRFVARNMEKEKNLIRYEGEFWNSYVMAGKEPPAMKEEIASKVVEALSSHYKPISETVEIPEELKENIEQIMDYDSQLAAITKQQNELKEAKARAMIPLLEYAQGKTGVCEIDGNEFQLRYQTSSRTSISKDDLVSALLEFPEIQKFVTTSESGYWKVAKPPKEKKPKTAKTTRTKKTVAKGA